MIIKYDRKNMSGREEFQEDSMVLTLATLQFKGVAEVLEGVELDVPAAVSSIMVFPQTQSASCTTQTQ